MEVIVLQVILVDIWHTLWKYGCA